MRCACSPIATSQATTSISAPGRTSRGSCARCSVPTASAPRRRCGHGRTISPSWSVRKMEHRGNEAARIVCRGCRGKAAAARKSETGLTRLGLASLAGSIILAALLIVVLFVGPDLDLAATGRLLLGLRPQGPVEIVLLMGLGNFLAGEKWRLVVLSLGTTGLPPLPRPIYFALSAIGVALSQILPVQLTTALSRSIGARAYGGHAISRGVRAASIEPPFAPFLAG